MIRSKKLISNISRPDPESTSRIDIYRFEKNERTTLFDKKTFNDIIKTLTPFDLVAYGEIEPFYDSACNFLMIERNQLLVTPGGDQGIKYIFETFLNVNDEVINFKPNYAMYSVYTEMFGGKEIVKYFQNDLSINEDEIIKSINSKTKFIIISNPGHNGKLISKNKLLKILEIIKSSNTILVIDEAYVDFSKFSMINYINKYKNLIIVRTLSKGFGLASIRVGFLISCKQIIREVYKVKPVHEISGVAAKISKYLIENNHIMSSYVNAVELGKSELIKNFQSMGIEFLPTDSNFMYFKLNNKIDSKIVYNKLLENKIYIRSTSNIPPFNNYLRVTIGDQKQMNFFCSSLKKIINKI
tara:strand:- start:1344 stop:2411 length:1068 start_codon:yes stop_codon:yes gene_type:complete